MMKTKWRGMIAATLLACCANDTRAASILIDFGGTSGPTLGAGPTNDPLRYWNHVPNAVGTSDTGVVNNLVTTTNEVTTIDLRMYERFTGVNTTGTLGFVGMPTAATGDSLFGNGGTHEGMTNVLPSFYFAELDTSKTYHLTFFASRTSVPDNRETLYTVTGDSVWTTTLNASNNVSDTVTLYDVRPNALGEIWVKLTPGVNNNNSSRYIYVNYMEIQVVPEPSRVLLSAFAGTLLLFNRRRF